MAKDAGRRVSWAEMDAKVQALTGFGAREIAVGLALDREHPNTLALRAAEAEDDVGPAAVIAFLLGDGEDDQTLELAEVIEGHLRRVCDLP